jgi:sulfur-oxidizing protein SoxY
MLGAAAVAGTLAGGRLPSPGAAVAQAAPAPWNKEAFAAQSVDGVIKALGAKDPAATKDVSWGSTPEIAENGAVVPVSVTSRVPNTASIALIIEKNPNKLAANFHFPESAQPVLVTRVKISESSNVHALIRTKDDKFFLATREIKVTLGGCGG